MKILRPNLTPIPFARVALNIGAGLDVPTGNYVTGQYGDMVLNGGLSQLTGIAAVPNTFKSTIQLYMLLCALERILTGIMAHNDKAKKPFAHQTSCQGYDTEVNMQVEGLLRLIYRFKLLVEMDAYRSGIISVSDAGNYMGDAYYDLVKEFRRMKTKMVNELMVPTAFYNHFKGELLQIILPTFEYIDSFSRFDTQDVDDIRQKNSLGDSAANAQHLRQNLTKTAYLVEQPAAVAQAGVYLSMVAHVGETSTMGQNPMAAPLPKKLQDLPTGLKLKMVPDQFLFLTHNCWYITPARPMINQDTKEVRYPRDSNDNNYLDPDLKTVTMVQLRGKNGMTGVKIPIVISQQEGLLPHLSNFNYLKEHDVRGFGFNGNNVHYELDLMPGVKMGRTTVRGKLDSNPALCRAMEFTAELRQIIDYKYYQYKDLLCTPAELFKDIQAAGYDWDELLATRGWHTVFDSDVDQKRLTTLDLLRMRKGLYKPYWKQ